MSYFSGKNLDAKVKAYDLTGLADILEEYNRSGYWPGLLQAEASPDILENMRVVVYSMLHRHGIKEFFVVKIFLNARCITIDLKQQDKIAEGGFRKVSGQLSAGPEPVSDDRSADYDFLNDPEPKL